MQDNLNREDFSEEFAPLWRQFTFSQISLFIGWLSVFAILGFLNIRAAATFGPFIFFATIFVWAIYFYFHLKCPKCGYNLFFYVWAMPGRSWFWLGGECPSCNAVLKKRLFSEESQIKLRNRLLLILAVVFILGIIGAFMKGSIKITRQHIELPPSKCR